MPEKNTTLDDHSPILHMGGENDWEQGITETSRADRNVINGIPTSMLSEIEIWERFLDLQYTRHAKKRLQSYLNQKSERPWEDGHYYIEMYPSEYIFLDDPSKLQPYLKNAKRIEMGFNPKGQVCKVSYVLDLTTHCAHLYSNFSKPPTRWLFFCVGVDGFIKTINITPGEKYREYYGGDIEYVNYEKLLQCVY